jgi:hypothetical protein
MYPTAFPSKAIDSNTSGDYLLAGFYAPLNKQTKLNFPAGDFTSPV